jgi:hypothetical protein
MNTLPIIGTSKSAKIRLARSRSTPVWNGESISDIHNATRPHFGIPPSTKNEILALNKKRVDDLTEKLFKK